MLVNLTPHAINILVGDQSITVPPSGAVARCATTRRVVAWIDFNDVGIHVPVNRTEFGAVDGLPDPQDGCDFIVSSLVAQALPDRNDLFIPDDTVRDEAGRIVGCRALARL